MRDLEDTFALAAEGFGPPAAASPPFGRDTEALLDAAAVSATLRSSTARTLEAAVDPLAGDWTGTSLRFSPVTFLHILNSSHCASVTRA